MAKFVRGTEVVQLLLERADWRVRMSVVRGGKTTHGAFDNFAAHRDYAAAQRALYADGFHRAFDRAAERAVTEPESGIADLMVRADWLIERGHPRGPLIVAGYDPDLVAAHADVLLGALASEHLRLGWERGYIARARLHGVVDAGEDLLWELLRHPSGERLRELVIGCHQEGDQDNRLMAATLLHAGPRPPLEVLELADFDESELDHIDLSRALLGDLTGLGQAYPRLRDVALKGRGDVVLGALQLPRARRFALRTSSLTRSTLASILAAPWPALEELELWFGDEASGCECALEDALRVLRLALPRLRVLRLLNAPFTDELVPHLARAQLVRQLRVLDLSLGTLSDDGAGALLAHADAYQHLDSLGVHDNCLTRRGLHSLRAVLPADPTPSAPARAPRADRQKSRRYPTAV